MRIKSILLMTLSLIILGISTSYSQNLDYQITRIDSLTNLLNKVDDFQPPYSVIFTDGQTTKRKILGIFKSHNVIGGYAEKYTLKDSVLIKLWKGSRLYINKEKTINSNTIENFIYNNESLSYYKESKYFETKGEPDSLVYEIEYYVDNDSLLKALKKGMLNIDDAIYFDKILLRSRDWIKNKNEIYKN